jgi:hypothetical protein
MGSDSETGSGSFTKDETVACEKCGRFGALEVNGKHLCEDCYTLCGSCCQEAEEDGEAAGKRKTETD